MTSLATELTERERELGAIIAAYNQVTVQLRASHDQLRAEVARREGLCDELGVIPGTVHAGIAPSAGPCCYEVGTEVRDEALERLGSGAARWFFRVGERWHLDLWSANLAQLTAAGVPASQVWGSGTCTICQGERFWSWRIQGESAGRFAAMIGLSRIY